MVFSPPFAADTLLPNSDRACREIAEYLKATLNADYQSIASQLTNPLQGPTPVVVGVREWNAWSNNQLDFPLLCVFRRGSVGLEQCEATVAYYLPSMAVQDQMPGILRWVETRIIRALQRYSDFFAGGSVDTRHANINHKDIRTEYGFIPNQGVVAFPFVFIQFNFEEIGV